MREATNQIQAESSPVNETLVDKIIHDRLVLFPGGDIGTQAQPHDSCWPHGLESKTKLLVLDGDGSEVDRVIEVITGNLGAVQILDIKAIAGDQLVCRAITLIDWEESERVYSVCSAYACQLSVSVHFVCLHVVRQEPILA